MGDQSCRLPMRPTICGLVAVILGKFTSKSCSEGGSGSTERCESHRPPTDTIASLERLLLYGGVSERASNNLFLRGFSPTFFKSSRAISLVKKAIAYPSSARNRSSSLSISSSSIHAPNSMALWASPRLYVPFESLINKSAWVGSKIALPAAAASSLPFRATVSRSSHSFCASFSLCCDS